MDDLDELLANLDNPRASTRPKSSVNYDELNELMQDLASPVDVKPSQQNRASQAPYSSHGSEDYSYGSAPSRNTQQPNRNTQQPNRNTQQPVRNTQSAVQLDDLDELLRNLGPPSSTHTPAAHNHSHGNANGSQFYAQPQNGHHNDNRQSYGPGSQIYAQPQNGYNDSRQAQARNTITPVRPPQQVQQPAQAQQPMPRTTPVKPPTGRPLDGPDLDAMLADINRTSTRGFDHGGPSSRGDCAQCRKPILGEVIQALNKTYHPEHFVCGNCSAPLGTNNFYEQDGAPNCERCYQELFCSRCAHCDEPITGRCITALNRKWHADHFICAQCLGPFPGGTFFEKEGRPYCDNCFHHAFSARCGGCNQAIKGECINALGQQWHPEHFVCQYCQKSFGTGTFYEFSGKPYCETHYHQQTGSLCAGCGKAVSGRMINALDKKWHPEHFVCSFCMQPLAGGAFTENAGKAYCKECHGKLFG